MADKDALVEPVWSRQPNEREIDFADFVLYRDLGEARSFDEVARRTDREVRTLKTIATRWHWRHRAWEWDRRVDAEIQIRQVNAILAARARQAKHSAVLQQALLQPAVALLNRLGSDPRWFDELLTTNPGGVLSAIEKFSRVWTQVAAAEREALGMGNEDEGSSDVAKDDWRESVRELMNSDDDMDITHSTLRRISAAAST